jgi:small GTP-binding protein
MPIRLLISLVLIIAAVAMLFLMLLATDTALSVWQRLGTAPLWMQLGYGAVLLLIAAGTTWMLFRWLLPTRQKSTTEPRVLDETALQDDLLEAASSGIDVTEALAEIQEQRDRKLAGSVHLALFGEVSSGKSSLVKALLPDAGVESDVLSGTTTDIIKYTWIAPSGDQVIISDLPGFNDAAGEAHQAMRDEALRAHLVIYLCDTDLGRVQYEELKQLQEINKPLLIAINKSDRYSSEEQQRLRERLEETTGVTAERIISVTTGGSEQIITTRSDGSEQELQRPRAVSVAALLRQIQKELDQNRELIESLRDSAALFLVSEKLDAARLAHRDEQAEALVGKYSRRAVIGALAAITPGSDLVIQGALATSLINELCRLFDVRARDVEIDKFLRLAGSKVQKLTAITLAISGNVLKAFPGLGTVGGGLMHAVAYGMIFDSLGRAVADTLASRGELRAYPAAASFEELMSENIQSRARRFARLALAEPQARENSDQA